MWVCGCGGNTIANKNSLLPQLPNSPGHNIYGEKEHLLLMALKLSRKIYIADILLIN
jgi:hypothetical protein